MNRIASVVVWIVVAVGDWGGSSNARRRLAAPPAPPPGSAGPSSPPSELAEVLREASPTAAGMTTSPVSNTDQYPHQPGAPLEAGRRARACRQHRAPLHRRGLRHGRHRRHHRPRARERARRSRAARRAASRKGDVIVIPRIPRIGIRPSTARSPTSRCAGWPRRSKRLAFSGTRRPRYGLLAGVGPGARRHHRDRDARRILRRVVHHVPRHHRLALVVVVPAGVQVAIEAREVAARHLDAQPVARRRSSCWWSAAAASPCRPCPSPSTPAACRSRRGSACAESTRPG